MKKPASLCPLTAAVAALALIGALGGCVQEPRTAPPGGGDQGGQGSRSGFYTFPDFPMPNGFDLDMNRTMIVGANDSWFGQMVITTRSNHNEMFDYYKRELVRFGWEEVTSIRAPVSVLTYARQDRVATLQIQGRTLLGAEVLITMSPRGTPSSGGMSGGAQGRGIPGGGTAPIPSVQTIR